MQNKTIAHLLYTYFFSYSILFIAAKMDLIRR